VSQPRVAYLAMAVFGCLTVGANPEVRGAQPDQGEALGVSLLQLVATPTVFDGKRVRVVGFLRFEFEGDALYLHREDFDHRITKNAVWLDVQKTPEQGSFSGSYVLVEATFDAEGLGHGGLFSGTLRRVSRLQQWPPRNSDSGDR
jgi:hypothetical protein